MPTTRITTQQCVSHTAPTLTVLVKKYTPYQDKVWSQVLLELKLGRKETHWMWFVFPQLLGLGKSPMSIKFAIQNIAHAKAFWEHPILGTRLRTCFELVQQSGKKPIEIFGHVDTMKYNSCKKLFKQFTNN